MFPSTRQPLAMGIDLWYVENLDENLMDHLVIKPEIVIEKRKNGKMKLQWHHTTALKTIQIANIKLNREDKSVEVQATDNQVYEFVPLTLDLYNRKIKPEVEANEFKTFDELKNYYLNTNFYAF